MGKLSAKLTTAILQARFGLMGVCGLCKHHDGVAVITLQTIVQQSLPKNI